MRRRFVEDINGDVYLIEENQKEAFREWEAHQIELDDVDSDEAELLEEKYCGADFEHNRISGVISDFTFENPKED